MLVGAPLKQNEFLKIDQTCLAEVLAEEAGNEHLKVDGLVSPEGERKREGEEGESRGGGGPRVTLGGATIVLGELPVSTAEQGMEVSVLTCTCTCIHIPYATQLGLSICQATCTCSLIVFLCLGFVTQPAGLSL